MRGMVSWGSQGTGPQATYSEVVLNGHRGFQKRPSGAAVNTGLSALLQSLMVTSDYGVWSALALAGASGLWSVPCVVKPSDFCALQTVSSKLYCLCSGCVQGDWRVVPCST